MKTGFLRDAVGLNDGRAETGQKIRTSQGKTGNKRRREKAVCHQDRQVNERGDVFFFRIGVFPGFFQSRL